MDTFTTRRPVGTPHSPLVEALLEEIATLDATAAQERMMPAGCYTAPEFFAFEQREVFSRTWI